jgi:predicted nucleic acid-binding protein
VTTPKRYYWDASVFLAFFNNEKGRVEVCERILNHARNEKCQIITSSFSLVEVIHIKGRERLTRDKQELLDEFFKSPYISLIDATRRICDEARKLIWQYDQLRPMDSTHLASALFGMRTQPDEIHSYDPHFIKLNGKLGNPPVLICVPSDIPGALFTGEAR